MEEHNKDCYEKENFILKSIEEYSFGIDTRPKEKKTRPPNNAEKFIGGLYYEDHKR